MSIIRAIKHRLGLSVTPANNFVLTAEADNGTMKLARESGQDIMTVAANGKPSFPQIGSALDPTVVTPSWFELPNGFIIQTGESASVSAGGGVFVNFPRQFPNACLSVNVSTIIGVPNSIYALCLGLNMNTVGFDIRNPWTGGALNGRWIAIGY